VRVTVLGCGGSGGVPLITGEWGRCDPANPRNKRRRPSILVETATTTLLVDTGPDLRAQLLDAGCRRVDAVLYTHEHADHVHGIDDVRALNFSKGGAIDAYGFAGALETIVERFGYVFHESRTAAGVHRPQLTPRVIEPGRLQVGDLDLQVFAQDHGVTISAGIRIGRFAYSTDVVAFDEPAFETLAGVDTWIVGCLRREPHIAHAHMARVLEWVERLQPRRAILTHMNYSLDYDELRATLPAGVEPAYDGMVIDGL
jgi:phosphoribosyl 1,2-cyclic phosphate phosphodiesterase